MAGSRIPQPLCGTTDGFDIDTLALMQSPLQGPVCSFCFDDMIAEAIARGAYTLPKKKAARHRHAKHPHTFQCPKAGKLGALSAHYESGDRGSAAIGYDNIGGWSYGKYQIETINGTMKDFLKYAEGNAPDTSKKLVAAGGYDAALAGKETFKKAWIDLAAKDDFTDLQHNFIQARNYDPLVAKVKADCNLDVTVHSAALRDVVWSIAVQHGPGAKVISRALQGKSMARMTDEEIIDAIYNERERTKAGAHGGRVLFYFPKSTADVQKSVLSRFERERFCAKQMLSAEKK
jgi:hypothetical protein